MSLASFILKKSGYAHEAELKVEKTEARQVQFSASANVPTGYVKTARGMMRLNKNGKIDGRSLQRGKPKPSENRKPRGPHSIEHIELRRIFEQSKSGDEYAFDWRTESTYEDLKLRNSQVSYVYKIANIYGFKVSVRALKKYIVIKYVGRIES